jgi:hypothetical protein
MSVPRKEFRHDVVNRLMNRTPAGARVFANRRLPMFGSDIQSSVPAILVYTTTERVTQFNNSPRIYKRVTSLEVQIASPMIDTLDDALDVFGGLVERILLTDDTLGGLVESIEPVGSSRGYPEGGEREFAGLVLFFDVSYLFQMPDEITNEDLVELKSVYTKFQIEDWQLPDDLTESAATDLDL